MPDVTHRMKAEKHLLAAEVDLAAVHATLAVSQSLREIDAKLKWLTDQIVGAIHSTVPTDSRWLYWRDENDQLVCLSGKRIRLIAENNATRTDVTLDDGTVITVPLSFGEVSLQVGN